MKVEFGWVAFQFHGREAFIPAGAVCRTSRKRGPATPYFEQSSTRFRNAVEAFDRSETPPCNAIRQECGGAYAAHAALQQILLEASPKDAMTLWHLLDRAGTDERAAIFDRFVQLVGRPEGVTRDGVLSGDATMIDRCWNALQLMDVDFWRGWKRDWDGGSNRFPRRTQVSGR